MGFGSVAAAPGIKNPISAARAMLQYARRVDVLGRVPPLTLCGHGAQEFARAHGVEVVPDDQLFSDRARADWEYWNAQLRGGSSTESMSQAESPTSRRLDAHQDTVGAVCLHFPSSGATSAAAGVSSGGLLLKHPGRIGEAAVYGAGCWAGPIGKSSAQSGSTQWWLACSISGTGEAIMRANLARRISEELDRAWDALTHDRIVTTGSDEGEEEMEVIDNELDVHQILYDVLKKEFEHGRQEVGWDGSDKPTVGVLVMVGNGDIVRLYSAFTAAGMAIAYAKDDVSLRYCEVNFESTSNYRTFALISCRKKGGFLGLLLLKLIQCTRVRQIRNCISDCAEPVQ
ncbi:N-terminal nucleophile aminohydrolase [Schizophyllum commune Tattone D]|nr:N-terminal nucleophile aminohydrolase [Schizophyllum commune Tattone D]